MDAKGAELTPLFQFTSGQTYFEQSVYVRPYLSGTYPDRHMIAIQVLIDGQEAQTQSTTIEIQTESWLVSFFSMAATSLLEVSIASALIGWAANAIDTSLSARKERADKIQKELDGLSSLSYLEQMDKVRKLENKARDDHLDGDVEEEIQKIKKRFEKEEEFFCALGEQLRQDCLMDFVSIKDLHKYFYPSSEYKNCLDALEAISKQSLSQENILSLIEIPMRLWDRFDITVKDFIVGFLSRIPNDANLANIAPDVLWEHVLKSPDEKAPDKRRRILRDIEIQRIFPQMVDPSTGKSLPLGYDAKWLYISRPLSGQKILEWLKTELTLVFNPFGASDLKNYPFYPEGFARPDNWTNFLNPIPQIALCPTPEDARVLTFYLRAKCLPTKKADLIEGGGIDSRNLQVFPIGMSFNQSPTIESPLLTVARSAAQAWLDLLCLSPDAMLDLLPTEQETLLDLLFWTFGTSSAITNLLKRAGLRYDNSGKLLIQKIEQFKSESSSTLLPQDAILLSWLKIRPPELNLSYLIIILDEIPINAKVWWLEQLASLISTLFLNGIVIKAFASSHIYSALPISPTRLNWSNARLKTSLNAQFEAAMDGKVRYDKGITVDFRTLFGSHPLVGYLEREEDTTDKLIAASHNSLARMLTLGNLLLDRHCEQAVPEPYLSIAELEAILDSA